MKAAPLRMGQAMARSGFSRKLLRRMCRDGTLDATQLDNGRGDWLIDADSLERVIAPAGNLAALEIARSLGL